MTSNLTATGEKKVYPRDSVRLFKSDFLEMFTHSHPILPLLIWSPIIAFLVYRSFTVHGNTALEFLGYGALGLFVWSLAEYVMHRFVFHYPAKSKFGLRMVYLVHGLHHEDPLDKTRLVMPPLPAAIYAAVLFPVFRFFLGVAYAEAFIACFLIGYLAYDYVHYYVHHFTPKFALGKFLKRYHLQHHYSNYDSKWGVSNPLWDYVFGTVEAKTEAKNSASRVKTA